MTMEKLDKMIETQREIRGLNRPWYVRYVLWLGELARGNLGRSMISKIPVSEIIGDFTWPSVQLKPSQHCLEYLSRDRIGRASGRQEVLAFRL